MGHSLTSIGSEAGPKTREVGISINTHSDNYTALAVYLDSYYRSESEDSILQIHWLGKSILYIGPKFSPHKESKNRCFAFVVLRILSLTP